MIRIMDNLRTITEEEITQKLDEIGYTNLHRAEGVILDTRPIDVTRYLHLKVISRVGVGLDNIDLEACEERGVQVFNTPCVELTRAVAEFTLMLVLRLLKESLPSRNLEFMGIGIIGYGRIGEMFRALLGRMLHSGINIYDSNPDIPSHTKGDVLEFCDIVTIHVSGNEEVVGEKELELMKDGSYLVNTARKECINEKAVSLALRDGKLAGFASDVNSDMLFRGIGQNVILTPHIAGDTLEARTAMERMAVENLVEGLKNAKENKSSSGNTSTDGINPSSRETVKRDMWSTDDRACETPRRDG